MKHPLRRRLFWLLVSTAAGLGIGLIGHAMSDDPLWFLALPAALAAGWLYFADPEACLAACRKDDEAPL